MMIMAQLDGIKNQKLRAFIANSETLQSLPEEQLAPLVERMSKLSPEGQKDMAKLLEEPLTSLAKTASQPLTEEEKKADIKTMETMTVKVMDATRRLDRYVLQQNEAESDSKDQAENLLKNL